MNMDSLYLILVEYDAKGFYYACICKKKDNTFWWIMCVSTIVAKQWNFLRTCNAFSKTVTNIVFVNEKKKMFQIQGPKVLYIKRN